MPSNRALFSTQNPFSKPVSNTTRHAMPHNVVVVLAVVAVVASAVPFVTKRVSLHNPIAISFGGWRPLRDDASSLASSDAMAAQPSAPQPSVEAPLDRHFLTVPVAVETDAEHELSDADLSRIRQHVIQNWRQTPQKQESFAPEVAKVAQQLLPQPEVELTPEASEGDYTFVKMDKRNASADDENVFHAYFGPRDHTPPDGYVRLTRHEFKALFKNADILFI